MNETQFCINWDSYSNHVSKGFSSLQQNAEFVDMTLAAEGHLVQVHQNIVALASPYLKAMLQSASCQHPVIFLNNISHEILGNILEYIYTGEVKIPTNAVDIFIAACRSLHINGINNIDEKNIPAKPPDSNMRRTETAPDNLAAHITVNTNTNNVDYDLVLLPNNNDSHNTINHEEMPIVPAIPVTEEVMDLDSDNREIDADNNENQNQIDINSINDFIILKPKTGSDDQNVNTNVKEKKIKVIRDITIKTKDDLTTALTDWKTNFCSSQEEASNSVENPVDISLNNYQSQNLVNFTLNHPTENVANLTLNTDEPVNSVDISLNNQQTVNLLNISSNHPTENLVNLSLNTDLTEHPVEISLNTNPIENPVKITLDTDHWFSQANQNTSSTEHNANISKLNTNNCLTMPIQASSSKELNMNPIKITLSTKDWQYEPSEDISHIELTSPTPDDAPAKSYGNITMDKKIVFKNLKKIASLAKLSRAQDKMVAITQKNMDNTPHFTVSNRGALQLILNHFLYGAHHNSDAGRKQRWRCADYRKMHCPAYVDTENDGLIAVSADHDHPNHDNRIRIKIKKNLVFTSLSQAVDIYEKACKDNSDKGPKKKKRRPRIPL